VIAKEELLDVGAIGDQSFQRHGVHRRRVGKHHQLQAHVVTFQLAAAVGRGNSSSSSFIIHHHHQSSIINHDL